MSKETGGPAFPVDVDGRNYHPGQTLRDYFAGKALQGILAAGIGVNIGPSHVEEMESVAKTIYLVADAMIAARGE
ncbi:hypothetical protein WB66_11105 [bacteria symbiont BFo1 of Frankliniella occidentalis]|nr:hypothetical protein AI28_08000 [bacteria symbiont BFo1 of Frankliniella occidentalis]KYP84755.1 hypothetical protein WB66_11105 [bacteria symbiont BFo1 of Frankliniella occidentalis]